MKLPSGFQFSGVAAGIKPKRKDLALIWSDRPAAAAGVVTVNKAKAAPAIDASGSLRLSTPPHSVTQSSRDMLAMPITPIGFRPFPAM